MWIKLQSKFKFSQWVNLHWNSAHVKLIENYEHQHAWWQLPKLFSFLKAFAFRLNREATSDRISLGMTSAIYLPHSRNHRIITNYPIRESLPIARNHNRIDNDLSGTWSQKRLAKGLFVWLAWLWWCRWWWWWLWS